MSFIFTTQILVALALIFAVLAFSQRLQAFSKLSRPVDKASPKGSLQSGVLYAYTLGMAPWSKESTRLHAVAYLRGVAFHVGIFLGLFLLVASPWLGSLPQGARVILAICMALGALFGFAGLIARSMEPNVK